VKRVDEVERRYAAGVEDGNVGSCNDIQTDSVPEIERVIARLPEDVDPDLRQAVEESFARLEELTREGCADVKPPETDTETTPEPEPDPDPVPTEPVPEATETGDEPPAETTPKKEKKDVPGKGQGGGSGPVPPSEGGGSPAPESDG